MNMEMAYLIGMYYGNGRFQDDGNKTTFFIDIPYKTLFVDNIDVSVYVQASVNDLKNYLQPLLGVALYDTEGKKKTTLSFVISNGDSFVSEFKSFIGNYSSCRDIRVTSYIKGMTREEKRQFLKGFSDVTGYIRNSNRAYATKDTKGNHRVYLEVPQNWFLVVDICNLLKDVGVPVATIDWAHPNIRDGNLTRYNKGFPNFWKKEHQIKIWAQEFLAIGFSIRHKQNFLMAAAQENISCLTEDQQDSQHMFYWEKSRRNKTKPIHPGEDDTFIPLQVRKHYDSWQDIAKDLGYGE